MTFEKVAMAYREMRIPFRTFLVTYVIPIFLLGVFLVVLLAVLFPVYVNGMLLLTLFSVPLFLAVVVLLWPLIVWEHRGKAIDRDMHLFITRIGTLSTGDTSRQSIIELLSKMEGYRELADEVRKIYKLAEEWHVGLSAACRFAAKQTPSDPFSDFLYRLAHSMEAGDSAEEFFRAEQVVFMETYEANYRNSLRVIDTMTEVLISLVISIMFMMVMVALLPLIAGMDANLMMAIAVIIFLFTEFSFLYAMYALVPGEQIWYSGTLETPEAREVRHRLGVAVLLCFVFGFLVVLAAPRLPPMLGIAFTITPLLYPSLYVYRREVEIKRKDTNFPAFIRTLGSTQEATGKVAVIALKKLSYHDFGPLTDNIKALYKRVAMRINRQRAWQLFGAETNSELISKFSDMFVEGTATGGEPRAISRIISDNFARIQGLRIEKFQMQGRVTGILYGLAASMTVILYMALFTTEGFFDLFSQLDVERGYEFVTFLRGQTFDLTLINGLVVMIISVHAVVSMAITRVIGGGHWVGGFTHLVVIMWVAAIAAVLTQYAVVKIL
jgi:flagellar protein FlaJ